VQQVARAHSRGKHISPPWPHTPVLTGAGSTASSDCGLNAADVEESQETLWKSIGGGFLGTVLSTLQWPHPYVAY